MESQTKKSKYEIDMCNGTIMDKLISFSLPLMLSGMENCCGSGHKPEMEKSFCPR